MDEPTRLPTPRRRRRWLKRIGIAILVIPFLAVAAFGIEWKWTRVAGQRKLDAVTARLDAEDPGWRFEEIVAAHNAKAKENTYCTAVEAVKIAKRLPDDDGSARRAYGRACSKRLPNESADDQAMKDLEEYYPDWERPIVSLRGLSGVPSGRFPIRHADVRDSGFWSENVAGFEKIAFPLSWDAIRSAHLGNANRAVETTTASLRVLQAVDFEPFLRPYRVRCRMGESALLTAAQVLAWSSNADDSLLDRLQNAVLQEADADTIRSAIRGERALALHSIKKMDDRSGDRQATKHIPASQALCLEAFTDAMASLDKPAKERFAAIRQPRHVPTGPVEILAYMHIPDLNDDLVTAIAYQARCRCTAAGIACERYRIKRNRWPASLDDLAEFGIPKGLSDPFDGQTLRYKRMQDGVAVYSISIDGIDDGGEVVDPSGYARDLGFRLWNVEARKVPQPPPPIFDDTQKD
jgi:hypothetical protein